MIRILSTLVAFFATFNANAVAPGLPYADDFTDNQSINLSTTVADINTNQLGETSVRLPQVAPTTGNPFLDNNFIELDTSTVDSLIINPNPNSNVSFFVFRSGDFNGDGNIDLALFLSDTGTNGFLNFRNSSFLIYLHNGNNTNPYSGIPLTQNNVRTETVSNIDIADINNDGIDEIYVATGFFNFFTQFNIVNGAITQGPNLINPLNDENNLRFLSNYTFLNANNDDLIDLAVVDAISNTFDIHIHNGNPSDPYSDAPRRHSIAPFRMKAIDIDNDGDDDLVTSGDTSLNQEVTFLINDDGFNTLSTRNFTIGTLRSNYPNVDPFAENRSAFELQVSDLNSDGNLDVTAIYEQPTFPSGGILSITSGFLYNRLTDFSNSADLSNSFSFDTSTGLANYSVFAVTNFADHRPNYEMRGNFSDLNHDGFLDFSRENTIYTNILGDMTADTRGNAELTNFNTSSFAANEHRVSSHFFDFNNDGLQDYATHTEMIDGNLNFRVYPNVSTKGTPSVSESNFVANEHSIESVNLNPTNLDITAATLSAVDNVPTHTDIKYFVSNTGGSRWHRVQKDVEFTFPSTGTGDFRWRAELSSLTPVSTPSISSIGLLPQDIFPPEGYSVDIVETSINALDSDVINVNISLAEIGATYTLTISGENGADIVLTGTVSTPSFTASNIDTSGFDDGNITASLVLTDSFNNVGEAQSETIPKDRTPPTGYSIDLPDTLINQTESTDFNVTILNAEIGTSYVVTITDDNNQTVTETGSVTGATQNIQNIDLSSLNDGSLNASVVLTDSALNSGISSSSAFSMDTVPPALHVIEITDNPNIANTSLLDFRVTNAEVGTTFNYSITSSAGGSPVTGTTPVNQSTFNVNDIDVSSLSEGSFTITTTLSDNFSNVTNSSPVDGIKDTIPPTINVTYPSSQINSLNNTSVGLIVNSIETDIQYQLTITSSNGGSPVLATGTSSSTSFTETVSLENLNDGTLSFTWLLTDPQGNQATIQGPTNLILDTTPVSGHSIAFDNGFINSTNVLQTPITVSSIPSDSLYSTPQTFTATYTITSDNGGTPITGNDTITGSTSSLSISGISALNDGTLTISYVITDSAGNISAAVNNTIIKDTVSPTVGTIAPISSNIYINDSPDYIFRIENAELGSTISYNASGNNGSFSQTDTIRVVSNQTDILFTDINEALFDIIDINFSIADEAGNISTASSQTRIVEDINATFTSSEQVLFERSPVSITVNFNQNITDFTLSDLIILGLDNPSINGQDDQYILTGTTRTSGTEISILLPENSLNGTFGLANRGQFSFTSITNSRENNISVGSSASHIGFVYLLALSLLILIKRVRYNSFSL